MGYDWLLSSYGEGLIAAGARDHHGNERETWESNIGLIFYEADNCAATERKTEFDPQEDMGKKWHRKIQLANVFSRITNPQIDKSNNDKKENLPPPSYRPLSTIEKWPVPLPEMSENTSEMYENLWIKFEDEFNAIKAAQNHRNINVMLHLLEKYTSSIPAITLKVYGGTDENTYKKHPDVSLFDHLKISAACAISLYHYARYHYKERWENEVLKEEITGKDTWSDDQHPFCLIGGDLSGVQKFIYTISSKGALKMLKGRSFFLELLLEHTVDKLINEMELSRNNIVFLGGGHFYLIAPNIPSIKSAYEKIGKEINEYLFDAFQGRLLQLMQSIPFGKNDLKNISGIWTSLKDSIQNLKTRKWEDRLEQLFSMPAMPDKECLTQDCQICGREDKPLKPLSLDNKEILTCEHCQAQYFLGQLLQNATKKGKYPIIYRWNKKPPIKNERFIRIGDQFYQPAAGIFGAQKEDLAAEASAVYHINDWNLSHFRHPNSRLLLAGIYYPRDESSQDLEDMAANGFGIGRPAVLRMDVDHLGHIFSSCVRKGEGTLSRIASISRQLSLFFKYHLNEYLQQSLSSYSSPFNVVERSGERRLSVVYSGGDDLFLIGHWLDITEAAFGIRKAFTQFTANPYITISGGIAMGYAHDPVYRLAKAAGDAENAAKEKGRDSITLFDIHTFKWNTAGSFINDLLTQVMIPLSTIGKNRLTLPDGSISRAFLYRLLDLSRMHKKEKAWIYPKLAYIFGRLRPREVFCEPWCTLKNYIFSNKADFHHLEVTVLWTLLMMREGGER
ncbi:MAG: type III-A CRISPR-associated protein Cas10/Csm1 [bacterium]